MVLLVCMVLQDMVKQQLEQYPIRIHLMGIWELLKDSRITITWLELWVVTVIIVTLILHSKYHV